ncbi:hypothetical protein COOONC_25474 [Cooperia oncophora]
MPGIGPQLVYENNVYIQLAASFTDFNVTGNKKTDECELVLETMQKGKVMLNKQNRIDANSGNQLWVMCRDGCIENVGMSSSFEDVEWFRLLDGRLWCEGLPNMAVTHQAPNIFLSKNEADEDDVMPSSSQVWRIQRQRPGSGTLEVECLHSGPTLVVRITDREKIRMDPLSMPVLTKQLFFIFSFFFFFFLTSWNGNQCDDASRYWYIASEWIA